MGKGRAGKGWEVELESYVWEDGEEIGIGGCDAGGVEEGCYCAYCDGGGGCVTAAGVVLGSAANGDVFED